MTTNDFVQYTDEILKNFNLKTTDFESIDFEQFEFVSTAEEFEETDFNLVKEGILSADPIIWYGESVEFIGKCTTQENVLNQYFTYASNNLWIAKPVHEPVELTIKVKVEKDGKTYEESSILVLNPEKKEEE